MIGTATFHFNPAHVHLNPRGPRFFVVAFSITSGAVLLLRA